MDLKQLQAMGALAPRGLVKREVTIKRPPLKPASEWADPEIPETDESASKTLWSDDSLTIFVRKRSSVDFYELIGSEDRAKPFLVIFRCVCQETGEPVFASFEQVEQLREWMWMPLAKACNEVNAYGPKNSQPKTNSGTSSPSSSAAPSRKLRRAARNKNSKAGSPTARSAAP